MIGVTCCCCCDGGGGCDDDDDDDDDDDVGGGGGDGDNNDSVAAYFTENFVQWYSRKNVNFPVGPRLIFWYSWPHLSKDKGGSRYGPIRPPPLYS